MARREWQQLKLGFPIAADAGAAYATSRSTVTRTPPPDVAVLTNSALLAELLGRSNESTFETLAAEYGSLRRFAQAHPADLRDHGVNRRMLRRLSLLFEIARRHGEERLPDRQPLRGSYDVYAHFRERLAAETVEHFIAVLLDNKNRYIRDVEVGMGSLTSTIVHPRDVYSRVIRDAAAAVVFVHNHPSGDPTPSREDIEITRRLREVGEIIGVRVLDHVVIGQGKYVSFVDDGYW